MRVEDSGLRPLGESSYPCLAISRELGVDYGVILLTADAMRKRGAELNRHEADAVLSLAQTGLAGRAQELINKYVIAGGRDD